MIPITLSIYGALAIAGLLICFDKWNIRDRYENSKFFIFNKFAPEYCEFCLSFWLSLLWVVVLFIYFKVSGTVLNMDIFEYFIWFIICPLASAALATSIKKGA